MRNRFVADADGRLDKLIASQTSLSRARARALVERGGVFVDGSRVRFASQKVTAGAVVEVRSAPRADKLPDVVERYRDAAVLVVDKPVGLATQSTRDGRAVHLYGLLGTREQYVGLHHRLDLPASGLVVVTLEKRWNAAMAQAFRSGAVKRDYLAVVVGDPGPAGEWTGSLDGQTARTVWTRLGVGEGVAALDVQLDTGRTHQIRRHAADAAHPLLGDRRHGGAAGRAWPRLALHAWRLRFPHPSTGKVITVQAPLPADLVELFAPLLPAGSPALAPSVGRD